MPSSSLVRHRFLMIWLAMAALALGSLGSSWAVADPDDPQAKQGDDKAKADEKAKADDSDKKPADDKPADKDATDKDTADKAKPKADKAKPPAGPREQTIYIPYAKLREVFEKEGRGVFVPYEKFQELWKAARDKDRPQAEKPPVAALITEAESEAVVEKEVVRVTAKLKIDLMAEGWVEVPLRLSDAVILSAKIGDQPARVAAEPNGAYKLIVEHADKKPQQIELTLEYAKAFTKAPGRNSVSFEAPQAPVSRWRIKVPQPGVKVNIEPLIAASEAPADPKAVKADETVLLAFVGAAPTVKLDWTPKAEGASGLAALASVETQQEIVVDEGLVRTRAQLAYTISRSQLDKLVIEVPADQKVVNVFDANVRQWNVEKADAAQKGSTQKITVQLFEPARDKQNLTVELEKLSGQAAESTATAPMLKAVDAARQQGLVVVRVGEGLRAEPTSRTGLLQLDAGELPPALAGKKWDLAYRYAALPFELTLSVAKVKPRIQVEELVETYLEPQGLTVDYLALFTIERAGVFEVQIDLPEGFELRQVRGHAAAGYAAAPVEAHHTTGDKKTRLVVNFGSKALGKFGLLVQLYQRLTDPNLLSPTGKAAELKVPLPRVVQDTVDRTAGRLVVYVPESLRVNPTKSEGLRNIALSEAYSGVESTRGDRFPTLRPVLTYAFAKEATDLVLSAERRKPQITAGQLLVVNVEAGVVKYDATFTYDIRYSGVKTLRIDVPAALAETIRNETTGLSDKKITPPPPELLDGYEAWSFSGEAELIGTVTIHLSWQRTLGKLEIGKSVDLAIPYLRPREVDRDWGQIAIAKNETIDVRVQGTPVGLRAIDPQHDITLPPGKPDAALAMEFHDDWLLTITATRYQLEEVKRTSIERAVARMVITRSNQVAVQALYRIRSARQRLGVKLPAGVQFDTEPLRIAGVPTPLERGKDEFFIPLTGRNALEPLLVELRYTLPSDGKQLELPEFPDEPAEQKVYLCVYLPDEQTLLGSTGPWVDESYWVGPLLEKKMVPKKSDSELVNWVVEGVGCNINLLDSFPTDGKMHLFSTLRPEPAPAGSLRMVAISRKLLHGLVLALIIGMGFVMLGRPGSDRLVAVGGLVVLVVVLGIFAPTLAHQILTSSMVVALALVLLGWGIWWIIHRPRMTPKLPEPPLPDIVTTQMVINDMAPESTEPPKDGPGSQEGPGPQGGAS